MNGLTEHLELLNTIQRYVKLAQTVSFTYVVKNNIESVIIRFSCPDDQFKIYGFEVEFLVTKELFERDLRRFFRVV